MVTDGSSSGPTAATREPYTSDPDDSGIAYWSQDDLDVLLGRAHRAGWQCTVHAVGDRAIEQTLDALARAQAEFPREGLRHRIDHCGITPPDLQERVIRQGIVPAMQPAFFWEFGDGYIRNYGRHRADVMFPARSLLDAGVTVAGSSDAPVTDHRPLFGIEQAMTRATMDGDVCGPDERVDLDTAIRMHTINGAYASFTEGVKGSIEPGKLADLVLLDVDLRDVEQDEVRDVPVAMTFVEGRAGLRGVAARELCRAGPLSGHDPSASDEYIGPVVATLPVPSQSRRADRRMAHRRAPSRGRDLAGPRHRGRSRGRRRAAGLRGPAPCACGSRTTAASAALPPR